MDIHQVSVNYLHEQDRILVRVNSRDAEEIRLWLTRRLCQGWLPMLRTALSKLPEASTDISVARESSDASPEPGTQATSPAWATELNKLHSLKQTDFKTPFVNEVKTWPMGAEPLLVTTIRMTPKGKDRLDMAFEESLVARKSQSRGFQASLEVNLLNGFMRLLEQAIDSSGWQLGSEHGAESETSVQHTDNDDLAILNRPKYLH